MPLHAKAETNGHRQNANERLQQLFHRSFERDLKRSPITQTELGLYREDGNARWDDLGEEAQQAGQDDAKADLNELRQIDYDLLSPDEQFNYRLFQYGKERQVELFKFRYHDYPVNQLEGWHTDIPALLINMHRIDSVDDALAYIGRLKGLRKLMLQVVDGLERRQQQGVLAPKFAYAPAIESCRGLLTGAPFTASYGDSTLFEDFKRKTLAFDSATRASLLEKAAAALLTDVRPAYQKLIECLFRLDSLATRDDGVWSLPNGDAYYEAKLRQQLTDESRAPDLIHALGLSEIERLHQDMRVLIRDMGYRGSLQEFFRELEEARKETHRDHSRLYYPNTPSGRTQYLADVTERLRNIDGKLAGFFATLPKSELQVKRVESFREADSPQGFYEEPAADGSRPGIYYVNLIDMTDMPKYELEVLAYHEALPGHHLQGSLALERKDRPLFRKLGSYNVTSEGWALYCEGLAREMGGYQEDVHSEFGRLSFELWRATRLVVDTGVHFKRWSRQRAVEYLEQVTPKGSWAKSAIERYMVDPAQATSYTIGMLKMRELRGRAEAAAEKAGRRFDIAAFHDVVLQCGSVPSGLLEEEVDRWIARPGV
jgi:uncharacterized protein (DUF885 family)